MSHNISLRHGEGNLKHSSQDCVFCSTGVSSLNEYLASARDHAGLPLKHLAPRLKQRYMKYHIGYMQIKRGRKTRQSARKFFSFMVGLSFFSVLLLISAYGGNV